MRFGIPLMIPMLGGGRLKVAKQPGEKWRRRKSNAAQMADLIALHKTIALCATCERRMPRKWGARYGYRVVHNAHTEANCDFQGPACEGYADCNLFHYVSGDYMRQWDAVQATIRAAKEQRLQITDRRRVFAVS